MNIIVLIALTIGCAVLDRLRGSGYIPGSKGVLQVFYGFFVANGLFLSTQMPANVEAIYFLAAYTACFTAGISIGWAAPLGDYFRGSVSGKKEWWQIGNLPKRPFASVVIRGLIWGVCTLPCYWLAPKAALISVSSIPAAFVLAAIITKIGINKSGDKWYDWHEAIRGGILGFLVSIWVFA